MRICMDMQASKNKNFPFAGGIGGGHKKRKEESGVYVSF